MMIGMAMMTMKGGMLGDFTIVYYMFLSWDGSGFDFGKVGWDCLDHFGVAGVGHHEAWADDVLSRHTRKV